MELVSIKECREFKNRNVLLRADFNVPIKNHKIQSDFKLKKSLATILYLLKKGSRVIIASHLGRPNGYDEALGLKPVVKFLEKNLPEKVGFIDYKKIEQNFSNIQKFVREKTAPKIILLDNIRFFPGEESFSKSFAKSLASLADIFVFDGFGVSHRKAASVSGVAKILPSFAGLLVEEEVGLLSKLIENPKHPLVLALGGIKLETKIPVIKKFLPIVDYILLGGGLSNTYWLALEKSVGSSVVDATYKKYFKTISKNAKIIVPVDLVVGKKNGKSVRVIETTEKVLAKADEAIYDIGPKTIKLFQKYLGSSKTIVWNGAFGFFEQAPYQKGTYEIAKSIAKQSKGRNFGVCGGGETEEILRKLHIFDDIDLVSTGGGAMLEFLGGKKLPGLANLMRKNKKV
jgi:phosphoglycerate kinase